MVDGLFKSYQGVEPVYESKTFLALGSEEEETLIRLHWFFPFLIKEAVVTAESTHRLQNYQYRCKFMRKLSSWFWCANIGAYRPIAHILDLGET
ncbi:uncharacterized protein [Primulina eburnea]